MYLFSKDSLKTEKEIIFEHTELDHLYSTIPLAELSRLLPIKTSKSGAPSWFDRKGLIGLLFLQSYTKGLLFYSMKNDKQNKIFFVVFH